MTPAAKSVPPSDDRRTHRRAIQHGPNSVRAGLECTYKGAPPGNPEPHMPGRTLSGHFEPAPFPAEVTSFTSDPAPRPSGGGIARALDRAWGLLNRFEGLLGAFERRNQTPPLEEELQKKFGPTMLREDLREANICGRTGSYNKTDEDHKSFDAGFPHSFKLSESPRAPAMWWTREIADWMQTRANESRLAKTKERGE